MLQMRSLHTNTAEIFTFSSGLVRLLATSRIASAQTHSCRSRHGRQPLAVFTCRRGSAKNKLQAPHRKHIRSELPLKTAFRGGSRRPSTVFQSVFLVSITGLTTSAPSMSESPTDPKMLANNQARHNLAPAGNNPLEVLSEAW